MKLSGFSTSQKGTTILVLVCLSGFFTTCKPKLVSQPLVADKPVTQDAVFIEILGVAQDAGYPQIDCRRVCCRSLLETNQEGARVVSLALVDTRNTSAWLFEATPDIKYQWSRITQLNRGKLPDGIFITHAHIGHYSGLMQLGRESMGAKQVPVYAMPRLSSFLSENGPWNQLISLENISLRPLNNAQRVTLNSGIGVEPVLVPHRDEYSETVGFLVYGPKKSLFFLPDIDKWERWNTDLGQILEHVDFALIDGTFYKEGELPGRNMEDIPHPFIEESINLFSSLPPEQRKRIYFIHFNHTNPLLWDEKARLEVEKLGFRIATEGHRFILSE